MKYFLLVVFLLIFAIPFQALAIEVDDWGKNGHRVTGEIAQRYLNKKAQKAIALLLDGQSLATTSTYADEIKSDGAYRSYGPWHYVNVPFDKTYATHPKSDKGDLLQGIQTCIDVLQNDTSSKEDKVFHLKLLVHFIGDLHQPLHTGIGADKGGNDFQVRWFNDGTNLHSVWDTKMIESYGMSYTELSTSIDTYSKSQRRLLQEGDYMDWFNDSRILVKKIYANTTTGEKLGYRYMYDYFDTVKLQLAKGGLRLAALLNDIFS